MRAAKFLVLSTLVALSAVCSGCGDRRDGLETTPQIVDRARLGSELLFVDASRNEVDAVDVMGKSPSPTIERIAIGKNPRLAVERSGGIRRTAASTVNQTAQAADPQAIPTHEGAGVSPEQVLVLCHGARELGEDYTDSPSLIVIDQDHDTKRYELPAPFTEVLLSEDARYALLWGLAENTASDSLLQDQNQVALVDLDQDPSGSNPAKKTLKATGTDLRSALITPPLTMPDGDVHALALFSFGGGMSIWDLAHPEKEEITIDGLSSTNAFVLKRLVADRENAQLYLIQQNEPDLRVLSFGAAPPGTDNVFWPSWNRLPLALSGASDMVHYKEGAVPKVLVAAGTRLAIVDTNDSRVATVGLPSRATRLHSFVGAAPSDAESRQRVLAWSEGESRVNFVELDNLEQGSAQKIETLSMEGAISDLTRLTETLMLVVFNGGIGTLDLENRRFRTLASRVALTSPLIESDARRVWVGGSSSDNRVAYFEPATLDSRSIQLDGPVQEVFQFEDGNERRIVATHENVTGELTIVDGTKVTRASSRVLTGFLLDGLVDR